MRPLQRHLPAKSAAGLAVVALAVWLLPHTVGSEWRSLGVFAAFWAIAVIGLDITWGVAGQSSLGQQGFIAVGAYAVAVATTKWGWPVHVAAVFAIAFGAAIAMLIGRVVLRLAEVYLALATLAFGMMVPVLATGLDSLGKASGLFGVPAFDLVIVDVSRKDWYWVGWAFVGVAVVLAVRFARSMTGLGWRLIAENKQAAESLGVATRVETEKAFMVSAAFAAAAGTLYATYNSAISPAAFGTQVLLIMLFSLILGGRGTIIGPVLGSMATVVAIIYSGRRGGSADLILGVAFILTLFCLPRGLAGLAASLNGRVTGNDRPTGSSSAPSPVLDEDELVARFRAWRFDRPHRNRQWGAPEREASPAAGVEIRGVSKRFGGLHSLSDVTITFEPGVVHGIVGPNGAGKSTLLAVASGVYTADGGEVVCFGDAVTTWPAWKRARRGMGRTFQAPQLAGNLTVLENVAGGAYSMLGAGLWRTLTPLEGRALREARRCGEEVLSTLGIAHLAESFPQDLSFGQQRLVELARALARAPAVLWLDEPASGLDQNEKQLLSTIVTAYARTGAVVGFIEHDTELVASTCHVATVLDAGRVVHHGPAASVFDVELVRELYMGSEHVPDPVLDGAPE